LSSSALRPPADDQLVFLVHDRQVAFGEARDCHRDAIGILVDEFDVVGREARRIEAAG
jgi:hypothetical protein